jgi:hypothetical protein
LKPPLRIKRVSGFLSNGENIYIEIRGSRIPGFKGSRVQE